MMKSGLFFMGMFFNNQSSHERKKMKAKKKIAIIGGGREGSWWKRFLETLGHKVVVSNRAEDNPSAINGSDVVIIAVLPSAISAVMSQVLKVTLEHQLIVSVCGLMSKMEEILKAFHGDVLFLHRMIGPQVETMKGHNLIINPIRLSSWQGFVQDLIDATEANTFFATSIGHDDTVGLTQAIARINILGLGLVAMEAPLPVKHFTNVPFTGLMGVLARVLDFGHLLSRDMVFENPFCQKWIDKLHQAMLRIEAGDEDFEVLFAKLSNFLGAESVVAGSQALAAMPAWWD